MFTTMLCYSTQSWLFNTDFFLSLYGDIPKFSSTPLKVHSSKIGEATEVEYLAWFKHRQATHALVNPTDIIAADSIKLEAAPTLEEVQIKEKI